MNQEAECRKSIKDRRSTLRIEKNDNSGRMSPEDYE